MSGKAKAGLAILLFLFAFAVSLIPAFSENGTENLTESGNEPILVGGVLNVPPEIIEMTATSSAAGKETLFTVTVFDANSGYDVCSPSIGPASSCNITCSFAELFSGSSSQRDNLYCDETSCRAFGQFLARDAAPSWEPKTSVLSARLRFGTEAKVGRWSCEIAVSDEAGEVATGTYSIYVRPESYYAQFVRNAQRVFFSIVLPAVVVFVLALQGLLLASRSLSKIDWAGEEKDFVRCKAYLDYLYRLAGDEVSQRAANKARGLFLAARELFTKGAYSEALWLAKEGITELGKDPKRVHVPDRLLFPGERFEIFLRAVGKRLGPKGG